MADPLPDDMPLDEIDCWSVRTAGALARAGYLTVGEVRRASDRDLLMTVDIGRGRLREIRAVLAGEAT